MKKAVEQSKKAGKLAEVPVGCVIVKDDKIIARGYNKRETSSDVTAHAEIVAIRKACKKLNSWRIPGCTLYVTLQPCKMCMGAIENARIDKVVFGAYDNKNREISSNVEVNGGILKNECSSMLSDFFKQFR